MADAQNLRGTPSEITDIAVKVSKPFDIQDKVEQWRLGARDKITSWQEASASILSVFKTQDIVRNSMTISIIVVAGFGIYNILNRRNPVYIELSPRPDNPSLDQFQQVSLMPILPSFSYKIRWTKR